MHAPHPTDMGIYDRDYYRDESRGSGIPKPRTMIGWIILINAVVFIADSIFTPFTPENQGAHTICDFLACQPDTLIKPWLWWQFLTYGFAHAPLAVEPMHIVFNMLGLFFLGRPVEQHYGGREFLRFYLVTIVVCGILGSVAGAINVGFTDKSAVVGASGGVVAVILLFICNYPHQKLLLFFVLPVPAWLVGVLLVLMNLFGHAGYLESNVAYGVHLVGLAFAGAYFYFGWNIGQLTSRFSLDWLKRRPKLRVHDPGRVSESQDEKLSREVDRILEKIHREGEASLTKKERRTLEAASRQYQKNRRDEL